jgi:replication fork clamp-binding protein CrfC
VTRRPLELRLVHLAETGKKPWAVFEELPDRQFTDFLEVRKTIEELTDKVAGGNKGIVDQPIILNIHSPTCPDLTLVDLPGITRIPLKGSDQPDNIEEITKRMALKYVTDKRTIILCVIPANIDLVISEALKMAREVDPEGLRTIGVITKIDIMDKGTNAKKVLMGQEVGLRLGFVGVKLRSQQDIINKKAVQAALEVN